MTAMAAPVLLTLYRELHELHAEMESCALNLRWAELTALQDKANLLIDRIKAASGDTLSTAQRQSLAELIKKILDQQATIRAEVSDWQNDVRPLLVSLDSTRQPAE